MEAGNSNSITKKIVAADRDLRGVFVSNAVLAEGATQVVYNKSGDMINYVVFGVNDKYGIDYDGKLIFIDAVWDTSAAKFLVAAMDTIKERGIADEQQRIREEQKRRAARPSTSR